MAIVVPRALPGQLLLPSVVGQFASIAENQSTTKDTKCHEGQFRRFPSCTFVSFVVDWFRNLAQYPSVPLPAPGYEVSLD